MDFVSDCFEGRCLGGGAEVPVHAAASSRHKSDALQKPPQPVGMVTQGRYTGWAPHPLCVRANALVAQTAAGEGGTWFFDLHP